eukprot:1124405-Prymnesium_polylepis.2
MHRCAMGWKVVNEATSMKREIEIVRFSEKIFYSKYVQYGDAPPATLARHAACRMPRVQGRGSCAPVRSPDHGG